METKKNNYKGYLKLSVLLIPVLSFINIIAPGLVKLVIRKILDKSKDFSGSVANINISLFKKRIEVSGFDLEIIENKEKLNFLRIDKGTFQFNTTELMRGRIVMQVSVTGLYITFIKDKTRLQERAKLSLDVPFLITSLKISNINLEYIDHSSTPPVKLNSDSINLNGINLTTVYTSQALPTKIDCNGSIYGGQLNGNVSLNLSEKTPAFDLNIELKNMLMPRLNSFFSAYGKFSVQSGLLSFYAEAAAKDGSFKGYVKPLITELEIKKDDEHPGVLNALWQEILTAATEIFKNHKEDQIATKLPMQGTFSKPDINVWYAIVEVLKNAFITALKPSIDHEININSVKK
jgi:hypothetical protein